MHGTTLALLRLGLLTLTLLFCFLASACGPAACQRQVAPSEQSRPKSNVNIPAPSASSDYRNQPLYQKLLAKYRSTCAKKSGATIEAEELQRLLETSEPSKVILLDERSSEEQAVSKLPGAIPAQEFLAEGVDPATTLVIYCTIGCRSGDLTSKLRQRGLNARNLVGGVLAWSWIDGRFIDSNGLATRRVHVYSSAWNYLKPGFEAVYPANIFP